MRTGSARVTRRTFRTFRTALLNVRTPYVGSVDTLADDNKWPLISIIVGKVFDPQSAIAFPRFEDGFNPGLVSIDGKAGHLGNDVPDPIFRLHAIAILTSGDA